MAAPTTGGSSGQRLLIRMSTPPTSASPLSAMVAIASYRSGRGYACAVPPRVRRRRFRVSRGTATSTRCSPPAAAIFLAGLADSRRGWSCQRHRACRPSARRRRSAGRRPVPPAQVGHVAGWTPRRCVSTILSGHRGSCPRGCRQRGVIKRSAANPSRCGSPGSRCCPRRSSATSRRRASCSTRYSVM